MYNGSGGTVQLIADVAGYYLAGAPTAPGAFESLSPARVLDTRSNIGAAGPVPATGSVAVQILGRAGVPTSGVSAVVVNVTVTAPAGGGFITAYPDGSSRPVASDLNFTRGQTIPNLVIVPVGADGKIRLYNGSGGTVQLIADVAGYYLAGTPTAAGSFRSLSPARILDTRSSLGAGGPVPAGGSAVLQILGSGGIPASGVSAIALNVTVTSPSSTGYLTVYPDGSVRPTASNLNFTRGQTIPNLVVVPVGADGKIDLYNGSGGTVQIIGDVAGYYLTG